VKARHRLYRSEKIKGWFNSTRKWIFLILLLLVVKTACLYIVGLDDCDLPLKVSFINDVSAQESNSSEQPANNVLNSVSDNGTLQNGVAEWNYDVVEEMSRRESMLEREEDLLRKEEERLRGIKVDIENDMEQLHVLEDKITKLIKQKISIEDEKMHKLAKVFEATPPEQAGPLLSKLDVDIAAQLILKMSSRKAGRIWGFVDPGKAVKISKELTRLKPDFDINKISGRK